MRSNLLQKFNSVLTEGISQKDLAHVLYDRLNYRYPDLVTPYGHEVVGDAIDDVASSYAGIEELGSIDIDIMMRKVLEQLEAKEDIDPEKLDESAMEFFASSGLLLNNFVTALINKMVQEARETKHIFTVLAKTKRGEPVDPIDLKAARDQWKDIVWAAFSAVAAAGVATAAGATGGVATGIAAAAGLGAKAAAMRRMKDWINNKGFDVLLLLSKMSGRDIAKEVLTKIQASGRLARTKSKYGKGSLEKMIPPGSLMIGEAKPKPKSAILKGVVDENLGTPYPGTYEQEYGPYKRKGQERTMKIAFEGKNNVSRRT